MTNTEKLELGQKSSSVYNGRVRKWYPDRAFGFIECEDGEDLFCHITKVVGEQHLHEYSKVEFRKLLTTKGLQASDVKVI